MLRRNSEEKISAMRINARNLRAKVRSMLPLDVCCKYLERNLRMDKLQNKKGQWERKERLKAIENRISEPWSSSTANRAGAYFSEKFQKIEPRHMFSKLAREEIEQICDHKHYFVGEAHLADFEEFMQPNALLQQKRSMPEISQFRTERSLKPVAKQANQTFQTIRSKYRFDEEKWCSTQSRVTELRREEQLNRDTHRKMMHLKQHRAEGNAARLKGSLELKLKVSQSRQLQGSRQREERKALLQQNHEITTLTHELKNVVCFHKPRPG